MRTYRHTTAVYRGESRLFYVAVLLFMLAAAAYAYFLSASVVNVVMRKDVDAQIASAGTAMSGLEADYIELQHALSAEVATEKGFVAAPEKVFIDRTEDAYAFSGN